MRETTTGYCPRLPSAIIRRHGRDIGPHGIAVYCCLLTYADPSGGNAYPGTARIAADCGMSRRAVQQTLDKLRALGLIECEERGSGRRASAYRCLLVAANDREQRTTCAAAAHHVRGSSAPGAHHQQPLPPSMTSISSVRAAASVENDVDRTAPSEPNIPKTTSTPPDPSLVGAVDAEIADAMARPRPPHSPGGLRVAMLRDPKRYGFVRDAGGEWLRPSQPDPPPTLASPSLEELARQREAEAAEDLYWREVQARRLAERGLPV